MTTWTDGKTHWLKELRDSINRIENCFLLLYDHLTTIERRKPSILPLPGRDQYSNLRLCRVENWATRFLDAWENEELLKPIRLLSKRSRVIFICHSTGGIVLKEAFCQSQSPIARMIKASSILLAFLATPHHGSRVLSKPAHQQFIERSLALEHVTGETFMNQMAPFSHYLEDLNQKFSYHRLGIQLWTHSEQLPPPLEYDSPTVAYIGTSPFASTNLKGTPVGALIVDPASSEVRNVGHHVMVDEEDWEMLPTDHAGTARLADDPLIVKDFIEWVEKLMKPESLEGYRNHRELIKSIFNEVQIEHHTLIPMLDNDRITDVLVDSGTRSLTDFIESGPNSSQLFRMNPHRSNTTEISLSRVPTESLPSAALVQANTLPENRNTATEVQAKPDIANSRKDLAHPTKPSSKSKPSLTQTGRRISSSSLSSLSDEEPVTISKEASEKTSKYLKPEIVTPCTMPLESAGKPVLTIQVADKPKGPGAPFHWCA